MRWTLRILRKKDEPKEKEIHTWNKARVQEQEERKLWIQGQSVHYMYGLDDEEDEAENDAVLRNPDNSSQ